MNNPLNKFLKKFISVCLVTGLTASVLAAPVFVSASLSDMEKELKEKEKQKNQTQSELNATQKNADELKDTRNTLQGHLNGLNNDLSQISSNLDDLEYKITLKNDEIELARVALEEAIEVEEEQYASMKKRIRFMYENGENMAIGYMFNEGKFSGFLNGGEYIYRLAAYDRKMLDQYKETHAMVQDKKNTLESEKQELDRLKEEEAKEHARVSGLVTQTRGSINQYSGQIDQAEAAINAYEAQIKQQEKDIAALKAKIAEEKAKSKLASQSAWRNISDVHFEEGDRYLLANLIYCEAGNQPYEGQVAVGAVVINRVLSAVFPNTVVGVIYAKNQFSPVGSGRLALALAENRATEACYRAADAAMAGQTPVGNCVFFRTPIEGLTGINIGGHVFY